MNKMIIMLLCILFPIVQAAEPNNHNHIMCLAHKTLLMITKDDISKYDGILGAIVVGKHEQDRLKKNPKDQLATMGSISVLQDRIMYKVKKSHDSVSTDDTISKPFTSLAKKAKKKAVTCDLMQINEPIIYLKYFGGKHEPERLAYSPLRCDSIKSGHMIFHNFLGETGLQEATNDLIQCYKMALKKGWEIVKNKENKSIGFNNLGKWIPADKATPAIFKALVEGLADCSGYSFVQLFVKKRSEFNLYKKLILAHNESLSGN